MFSDTVAKYTAPIVDVYQRPLESGNILDRTVSGTLPFSAQEAKAELSLLRNIILLSTLSNTALYVGVPIYTSQFKTSGLELGAFYSIGALTSALSRPIFGHALDTYGRRPVLLLGLAIAAISMLGFALVNSVALLFFAQFAQGLAQGTVLLASYTITSDLARSDGKGGNFGVTEESQFRGGIYGAILALPVLLLTGFTLEGELRITRLGWLVTFLLYAVGGVLAFLLAWKKLRETHDTSVRAAQSDERLNLRDRHLNIVLLVVLLTSASAYSISPFILQYVEARVTSDVRWLALAYIPSALANGLLPSRFGRLSDRVGRKPPMVSSMIASSVLSVAISVIALLFGAWPLLAKVLLLMVFLLVESMAYAASVPAEQALVADITGGVQRGRAFGMYTLAQSMGKVGGSLLMGGMSDAFAEAPFFINAAILLIAGVTIWFGIREDRIAAHNTTSHVK